jgi:hypothetical protein
MGGSSRPLGAVKRIVSVVTSSPSSPCTGSVSLPRTTSSLYRSRCSHFLIVVPVLASGIFAVDVASALSRHEQNPERGRGDRTCGGCPRFAVDSAPWAVAGIGAVGGLVSPAATVPAATVVMPVVVATGDALRVFDQTQVMTDGGPGRYTTTLSLLMWEQGPQMNRNILCHKVCRQCLQSVTMTYWNRVGAEVPS